jgi:cell division GTPase FtsZ
MVAKNKEDWHKKIMNLNNIKKSLQSTVYHHPEVKIVSIGAIAKQAVNLMINEGIAGVSFVHYEFKFDQDAISDTALASDLMNAHMVIIMGVLDERYLAFFERIGQISQTKNLLTLGILVATSPLNSVDKNNLSAAYDTVFLVSADQLAASIHTAVDFLNLACAGLAELLGDKQVRSVDFADIQELLSQKGQAAIGIGIGTGPERSIMAANQALAHPSLKGISLNAAAGVLLIIKANSPVPIKEMRIVADTVFHSYQGGVSVETSCLCLELEGGSFGDELRVSVLVTGLH